MSARMTAYTATSAEGILRGVGLIAFIGAIVAVATVAFWLATRETGKR